MESDYLIVGSGITGAVIARLLQDAGRKVLVLERRGHVGGNVYDEEGGHGIRVHKYGPHYFRTNSPGLWKFVNRFSAFFPYEAVVQSLIDGRLEHWPVSTGYIRRIAGEEWKPAFEGTPANFEEACLSKMPRQVYEKFIEGYTRKQWGKAPCGLSVQLAQRIEVRRGGDPRLTRHKYQGIPENGYAHWIRRILEGVPVRTGCDYLKTPGGFRFKRKMVYTGPIDEFFGFKFGRLRYRGQKRQMIYLPDTQLYQACGQVNYPSLKVGHIRILEWKHMMDPRRLKGVTGTVISKETPFDPQDPDMYEYPMADNDNLKLYAQYSEHARTRPDIVFCGRLGTYKYLDMDWALKQAMDTAGVLLNE